MAPALFLGFSSESAGIPVSAACADAETVCAVFPVSVVAPVDYVSWTEGVAEFAHRDDLGTRGHRLVIDAGLSPAAKHGMEAAGWEVVPSK